MKVLILAKNDSFGKIRLSVEGLSAALSHEPVQFVSGLSEIGTADLIVSTESELSALTDAAIGRVTDGKARLFVYFRGTFIDAQSKAQFDMLDDSLKRSENWTVLKEVNELRLKLNYLFRNTVLDSYPTFMQMELTDFCNAECIMCSHLYQKNIHAGRLSEEGLRAVRPILPYVKVAILHGNGEPFLHPMLTEILEEYYKYGIYVSTSTNLSVFNERIAGYINRCFADIRVSCDGCTKEIYEQIRRNLSFDTFTQHLEMLHSLCPDIKKMLMVVVMRQNIHQLRQFIPFAKQYGFSEVVFSNMMPSIALGNEGDNPLLFKPTVKYELMQTAKLGQELGIRVVYPDCYDDDTEAREQYIEPTFRSDEEIEAQRTRIREQYHLDSAPIERMSECSWDQDQLHCDGICDWCMERTYIDLHGNVFICCINNRYVLGNIVEESFAQVWNCTELQRIRSSFFSGRLPDFCEGCHFILNRTLPHLQSVERSEAFFDRRCISKVYKEHGPHHPEGTHE